MSFLCCCYNPGTPPTPVIPFTIATYSSGQATEEHPGRKPISTRTPSNGATARQPDRQYAIAIHGPDTTTTRTTPRSPTAPTGLVRRAPSRSRKLERPSRKKWRKFYSRRSRRQHDPAPRASERLVPEPSSAAPAAPFPPSHESSQQGRPRRRSITSAAPSKPGTASRTDAGYFPLGSPPISSANPDLDHEEPRKTTECEFILTGDWNGGPVHCGYQRPA